MKKGAYLLVGLMGLAFAGASTFADAAPQSGSKAQDVLSLPPLVSPSSNSFANDSAYTPAQSKVYQFNLSGNWGVKFDVNQPTTAPAGSNDIDAGAYYKLTPSLKVGGSLGFGEKTDPLKPEPHNQLADKKQPRVHLETTFSF